jgi:molybdopterin-synthase adenylyltransferase
MESQMTFDYGKFTERNLGFVDQDEQTKLQKARVFVCGVGGMGGACAQSLARTGVGSLAIADFDTFEISNLNRQVFANMDSVGQSKTDATAQALRKINPGINLKVYGKDWTEQLHSILVEYKIVINGMDDIRAGLHLYRMAREHGVTVIDAYASPLPSVTCVKPQDPRPEERLRFKLKDRQWRDLSTEEVSACLLKEMEYILANSSSIRHIHLKYAIEMLNGSRSRMSFAPMVITTGNLMCYEAVKVILGKQTTDYRGYFFNPHTMKTETPRPPLIRHILGWLVRRYMARLLYA